MKVPISWLRDYVDIPWDTQELAHRLTMAGTEVGGITVHGETWDNVLVGHVVSVEPHPNADRLKLVSVDVGVKTITVVCGAPNVVEGQKVPIALAGARLYHPQTGTLEKLKATKIRGAHSDGMVCSELELGLGDRHAGIMVLDPTAPIGSPLAQYLGDAVLELYVTPNRPDCLSILGVAQEVAALAGGVVREPQLSYVQTGPPLSNQINLRVEAPWLCPRYMANLITDITVGPSPQWLQDRLQKVGQRSINNVVDITNYVLMEYGQPLHAFDYATLADRTIIVRQARANEALVTLDGERRTLQPPMLVISDAQRAVGLAGIMGGSETEITDGTRAILLEAATFDPANTRRTASALKLRTEASARFDKGLHPQLAELALQRATRLILEVAGGRVATGVADIYPTKMEPVSVLLRQKRLRHVLGVAFPREKVISVLESLGFVCHHMNREKNGQSNIIEAKGGPPLGVNELLVTPPYWRTDVTIEDDLVEEVARILGYDNVPTTMLSGSISMHQPQPIRLLREQVINLLVASGMQETISYSLVSMASLEQAGALDGGPVPLRAANPMSPAQEYLRTSLRGSILSALAMNERLSRGEGLRLFEAGRVYLPRERNLPEEKEMVVGVFCGPRQPTSWLRDHGPMDFFDASGTVETLLVQLGFRPHFEPHLDPLFHSGRCAKVMVLGHSVGVVGELRQRALATFGFEAPRVALLELNLGAVALAMPAETRHYQSFPRYPGALRDMALVIDQKVPSGRPRGIIEEHPLVLQATVFDLYEGSEVPAGKKSLAFHVTFQSPKETLTSDQVGQAQQEILDRLNTELGAVIRGKATGERL